MNKADELDKTIKSLIAVRDGLRHAAVCSAPSHMECPKFRRLLGLAASGVISRKDVGTLSPKRRFNAAL